jgi:two-component system, OmpR family, response regulator
MKKILIIDDDVNIGVTLGLNLQSSGKYEVKAENDALEAVATAVNFKPDIILLDLIMPNKRGGEVAKEIKANPALKDIPIIFVTATITKEDVDERGGFLGKYSVIPKPCDLDDLVKMIEKNLTNLSE